MQTPAATPSDRLKRLRCPIAVLHGQNDKVCNFAQMKAIVGKQTNDIFVMGFDLL
jgi:dipeptidyl aminopeptidase/acylaminoacyl peptidase